MPRISPVGLTGNKRQKIWQLKQENKELRECLQGLINLYVEPYDPKKDEGGVLVPHEAPRARDLTPLQRRRDKRWAGLSLVLRAVDIAEKMKTEIDLKALMKDAELAWQPPVTDDEIRETLMQIYIDIWLAEDAGLI